MVDGYDSTITVSTALRNVFYIWVLFGMVMVVVGLNGIGNEFNEHQTRVLLATRVAVGALELYTLVLSAIWVARCWSNVRRLGKTARVGYWQIAKRHLMAVPIMIVLWIVMIFVPSFRLFGLLAIVGCGVFLSLMWVAMAYQTVNMLWRTSSPPTGLEEGLPHYAVVWVVAWVLHSSAMGMVESGAANPSSASLAMMLGGLLAMVAAVTASMLVVAIARRQDDRLFVIINQVDGDDENKVVTTKQIENAWSDSERLVQFEH